MAEMSRGVASCDPHETSTTMVPGWPYPPAADYPATHPSYTVDGVASVCAASLDQLSPPRVLALRERVEATGRPLEEWGPIDSAGPCFLERAEASPAPVAVLGGDGRYHLALGAEPLCGSVHTQDCSWTIRGGRYSVCGTESVSITWVVEVTREQVDPHTVHRSRRCPVPTSPRWPPFMDGRGRLPDIRRTLVAEFGYACMVCSSPGERVDHDHASGLVRGFLCSLCNGLVDTCPHLAGCRFQHYLDDPPASRLGLRYPNAADSRSNRRARAARQPLVACPEPSSQSSPS